MSERTTTYNLIGQLNCLNTYRHRRADTEKMQDF